jgi:hypothetical protein
MTNNPAPPPEVGQAVRVRNRLATVRAVEPYDTRTAQGRLNIVEVEYLDDYEGGVTASAQRGFARRTGPWAFDLNRANVVALREFVPGNRLYANRGTFYVARYQTRTRCTCIWSTF